MHWPIKYFLRIFSEPDGKASKYSSKTAQEILKMDSSKRIRNMYLKNVPADYDVASFIEYIKVSVLF